MHHWEQFLACLSDYLFIIHIAIYIDDYETFQYVVTKLVSRNGFLSSKCNLISKSDSRFKNICNEFGFYFTKYFIKSFLLIIGKMPSQNCSISKTKITEEVELLNYLI